MSWRALRQAAERGERPAGMTPQDEGVRQEYVDYAEERRAGYIEYDVETLFWRAKCGVRPARMSPRQTADYNRMVAEHTEHPDAVMPPHFD